MNYDAGYSALRNGRVSIDGQIYLVTFVTRHRRPVFHDFQCGSLAAKTLSDSRFWLGSKIFCWVLMPDHWHGLVQLRDGKELGRCVSRAKSVSALRINSILKRKGGFWQEGFHDHALRRAEDLKTVARYVVANPVRAGLVSYIGKYPFWNAVWL